MRHIRSGIQSRKLLVWSLLSISLLYLLARHYVVSETSLKTPALILINRIISFISLICVGLSFLGSLDQKRKKRDRQMALIGFGFGLIHLILTIAVFSKENFPRFFDGNKLNLKGEMVLMNGVLAIGIFCLPVIAILSSMGRKYFNKYASDLFSLANVAFFFVIIHVCILGIENWLNWQSWPMLLPPFSLVVLGTGLSISLYRFYRILHKISIEKSLPDKGK